MASWGKAALSEFKVVISRNLIPSASRTLDRTVFQSVEDIIVQQHHPGVIAFGIAEFQVYRPGTAAKGRDALTKDYGIQFHSYRLERE